MAKGWKQRRVHGGSVVEGGRQTRKNRRKERRKTLGEEALERRRGVQNEEGWRKSQPGDGGKLEEQRRDQVEENLRGVEYVERIIKARRKKNNEGELREN